MESLQSYNADGQMTGQTYPWVYAPGSPAQPQPAKSYTIGYDTMGRLSHVQEGNFYHLSGVSYGVGSEINSITYNNWTLTQYRYYNARLQMTRMWTPGVPRLGV